MRLFRSIDRPAAGRAGLAIAAARGLLWAALLCAAAAQSQSVTPDATLSFGAFVAGSGGTITVGPGGVRTASGNVTPITLARFGSPRAGSFAVQGRNNGVQNYAVSLPASVTLSRAGGGTMTIDNFVTDQPGNAGEMTGNPRRGNFALGARLVVGANQTPGDYTGTFNLTVTYP